MRTIKVTGGVLGLLGLAAAAHAATYVVDNGSPAAADANPGTREAPFKTIAAAAARAVAGDEVVVRPGLYRESVTLTNSGAPGRPIVFRSEEPLRAVLSGADIIVTGWKPEEPGVWSFPAPGLFVYPGQYAHGAWMFVDGRPLQYAEQRERLTPGSFYIDGATKRILVAPPEDAAFEKNRFEFAWREGLFFPVKPLDDIQIRGFKLIHNAGWFRGRDALRISGRRWLVESNHVAWSTYSGMVFSYSSDCVARHNVIEWSGAQNVGGGRTTRMLFENNIVRYGNWRRGNPSMEGGGSKWGGTLDSIVRGNEWYGNHGSGLWFDFFNCDNIFEHNVSHDNTIWGLFSEFNWNMIIRDNTSYNNGYGVMVAQNQGTVVRRNICFNNAQGLTVRGDGRGVVTPTPPDWLSNAFRDMQKIPGVDPLALERFEAGCLKMYVAPRVFLSNNSVFWENVVFNSTWGNYAESRNYATNTPPDAFVSNFSDYNIWHASRPDSGFLHAGGAYPGGLAGWQSVSGRDAHSIDVNPRTATNLPAWAEAKRALWDIDVRSSFDLRVLGLADSPEGQAAKIRVSRSATLTNVVFRDSSIRAFRFEVEGEPTLGLWTTSPLERRYLRLKLGQDRVTLENACLEKSSRELVNGALDLVITYVPTYLRGIGGIVVERPASGMSVPMFNRVGEAVPVTATFVNDGATPMAVKAAFTASADFKAEPGAVERTVAPSASETVIIQARPVGVLRKGAGRILMAAQLGAERLTRVASFGVGEGEGVVPRAPGAIVVDGKLDDWGGVVKTGMPVGVAVDISQLVNGQTNAWGGLRDLSGSVYAAWTARMLYVAMVVTDDRIVPCTPGGTPWGVDAIELFVDGRGFDMQWQKEPTEGCYQIGVSPGKGDVPANTLFHLKTLAGLQSATTLTDTGYIVEVGLPLTDRNFPAGEWKAGRPVKLSVLFNDKDDPAAPMRKYTFGWAHSPGGANYGDTSGWQTLVFGE